MNNKLPDDYTIRMVDMPISVGGRISECPDGHIDIYINARLSQDGRCRAAEHEMDHWRHDDLLNGLDIQTIETRHGRKLPPLIRARDLLPKAQTITSTPAPASSPARPEAPRTLTPYQFRVLMNGIADLDAFLFRTPVDPFD